MHFDTFEAFSRATYKHVGFAPISVHDAFEHIQMRAIRGGNRALVDDLSAATRKVTGMFVDLMRACYYVHETSTSHAAPGDDLLGYRLEQAAQQLPPGYELVIHVIKGHTSVMLLDADGRQQDFPSMRDSLSGQVVDALLFVEQPGLKRSRSELLTEDPDHGEHLTA